MTALPFAAFLFVAPAAAPAQTPAPPPPPVIEYSDGYKTRAKIHKIGSFAMLPLVGVEYYLGNSIYENSDETKKSAHVAVGAAIGTLFAVNTVTGVWNLYEGRHDPNGRTLRWVHSLLMLTADAGFLATAASAPDSEGGYASADARSKHRTIALTSLAIGTAGYLVMLFGK